MTVPQQRKLLATAIVFLLAGAVAILAGLGRLPLPVRLLAAGSDLIVASLLFVALRQKPR
jgi:hypothetical protein